MGWQIIHAAALALKSLLGLACDPVAGLVEVPCIKRNVIGAVNALTASDLAMAGILSRIPPDEVIDAMRNIGRSMPSCLKETGEGGTGCDADRHADQRENAEFYVRKRGQMMGKKRKQMQCAFWSAIKYLMKYLNYECDEFIDGLHTAEADRSAGGAEF